MNRRAQAGWRDTLKMRARGVDRRDIVLVNGLLPYRSGFTPLELAVHFGLFIGSVITLAGGHPALVHSQESHPRILLVLYFANVFGCSAVLTGVLLRRVRGSTWAVAVEMAGCLWMAGMCLAYSCFSFATSPAHNYTSYTLLASVAIGDAWRARQARQDIRSGYESQAGQSR